MIVIYYDEKPRDTIFYLSALLYRYIKFTCEDFEEARKFFRNNILDSDMMFYYSIDWLYLIGKVKEIRKGVIICA